MGSLFGGGDDGSADYYRKQEEARQKAIRAGTARINGIFDGTTVGTDLVDPSNLTRGTTYYKADGTPYVYQAGSSKGSGGVELGNGMTIPIIGDLLGGLRDKLAANKAGDLPDLYSGTTTTGGFDDAFYDQQKQNYLDFAMPQLEDQRSKAARELTYSLARSGNLESSARADLGGQLQKQYDTQAQSVASKALDYENQSRTNVENARSDLISMLNATGDAESAANSAIARSQALSATPSYNPLTSMFADFTNTLGTATAAERARAYGYGAPGSGTGITSLYSTPSSAVSVRG